MGVGLLSGALFVRKYVLTIGTLQISNLHITGSVKKNLKSEPNTAEFKVYNLSADHRKQIQSEGALTVQLEIGYDSGTSVVFLGDLRTSRPSEYDANGDIVSTIGGADGGKKHQTARVHVSHRKGTSTATVLQSLVTALGVLPGNSSAAIGQITSAGLGDRFTLGTVLSGSASREMSRILRSVGYTWSIQNGALQMLPLTKALSDTAILLEDFGPLIGSPSIDKDGVLTCKSLIIPDVFPGRYMVLNARDVKGQYRIQECNYDFDSEKDPWYITYKAKAY